MKSTILLLCFLSFSGFVLAQDDVTKGNQIAFYTCSDPIDIDSARVQMKEGKLFFHFEVEQSLAQSESADFAWFGEKPEEYFISYLVNATDSTFTAIRQDGSLVMIQEALDEKGNWQPIEYWVPSGCGNSYFHPLELESGKGVLVPIKKYTGNFATKIRLKFDTGTAILFSGPFEGAVNKSQFRRKSGKVYGILYEGSASYLNKRKKGF